MDILAQAARALSLMGPAAVAPDASSMSPPASAALKMQVYPAAGGHIAKLVLPTSAAPGGAPMMAASSTSSKKQPVAAGPNAVVPLYVILDRSGSMGGQTKHTRNATASQRICCCQIKLADSVLVRLFLLCSQRGSSGDSGSS